MELSNIKYNFFLIINIKYIYIMVTYIIIYIYIYFDKGIRTDSLYLDSLLLIIEAILYIYYY